VWPSAGETDEAIAAKGEARHRLPVEDLALGIEVVRLAIVVKKVLVGDTELELGDGLDSFAGGTGHGAVHVILSHCSRLSEEDSTAGWGGQGIHNRPHVRGTSESSVARRQRALASR
jgi:hypothetical protein